MARYRVLQGIDYPPNKRAEAGEVVTDLPPQSVKWLLDSGIVEDGFDADATDIDGDGFLQDGTPHQRPVEEK